MGRRARRKFFCDYCDVYLTHDSFKGRSQHCYGWKHRENYFLKFGEMLDDEFAKEALLTRANKLWDHMQRTNTKVALPELPADWTQEEDPTNRRPYYVWNAANHRTWVHPRLIELPLQPWEAAGAPSGSAAPGPMGMRPGGFPPRGGPMHMGYPPRGMPMGGGFPRGMPPRGPMGTGGFPPRGPMGGGGFGGPRGRMPMIPPIGSAPPPIPALGVMPPGMGGPPRGAARPTVQQPPPRPAMPAAPRQPAFAPGARGPGGRGRDATKPAWMTKAERE